MDPSQVNFKSGVISDSWGRVGEVGKMVPPGPCQAGMCALGGGAAA